MKYSNSLKLYIEEHYSEIWRYVYFYLLIFFADSWTTANFHFWEMLPLKDALFFTTKHVIDLLPVNLISYQLFLFCTAHFSCSFFFFYWLYLKKVENHITAIKFKDV